MYVSCTVKELPAEELHAAAYNAIAINPCNRPRGELPPAKIAVLTTKFWGAAGVHLTVGFLGSIHASLADKIISHMNAWGQYCNASFAIAGGTANRAQVRISFDNSGYWSYLGTDVAHIPTNQATMNLQGFNSAMPESEYFRVVRHETGHTLGCVHEHMRRAIVAKLDPGKTMQYFMRTQGWTPQEIQQQVLTPIEESSLLAPPGLRVIPVETTSVMCYALPGSITVDGVDIPGGTDITPTDGDILGRLYPKAIIQPPTPPPPPPPPPNDVQIVVPRAGTYKLIS